jgi:hypothetical protein
MVRSHLIEISINCHLVSMQMINERIQRLMVFCESDFSHRNEFFVGNHAFQFQIVKFLNDIDEQMCRKDCECRALQK